MSDNTKIEWADATVNAINGCSVTSPGCTNCYAMRLAGTRMKHHPSRAGLTVDSNAGPVWNGEVRFSETALLQPLRWKRPRTIFWNAHGDMFHENVPDEWIDRCFAVMALTPRHRHQVLTKRSARMRNYLAARKAAKPIMVAIGDGTMEQHPFNNELKPPTNIWLGVSVEDQRRADERINDLLMTPAAVRFLSCEPLLGPVDLGSLPVFDKPLLRCDALLGVAECGGLSVDCPKIDWVIVGGESGPDARPMHPDWARSIRDQCAAVGVPFHFKQWGEWAPIVTTGHHDPRYPADPPTGERMDRVGKRAAGRLLDGVTHDGMPA